jgi:hypothetical protein
MSKKVSEKDIEAGPVVDTPVEAASPTAADTPNENPIPAVSCPTTQCPRVAVDAAPQRNFLCQRRGTPVESKADIESLAAVTGTGSIVIAALKAEYGWTDKTKLSRDEFVRLRDSWLSRPARRG